MELAIPYINYQNSLEFETVCIERFFPVCHMHTIHNRNTLISHIVDYSQPAAIRRHGICFLNLWITYFKL